MKRTICIHGHFYQPPRENPWLDEIELQDSAYPYNNWNERITAECYGAFAASRILNAHGTIIDIINNYTQISFNFGPTLLSWMKKYDLETYQAICEADRQSQEKFSGHGAALAQAFNHMIMPLANARDKETQVLWGIRDFESHFKRFPEGMWLPETAVDIASLEELAKQNIKYAILAPHQAKRFRKIGEQDWQDVSQVGLNVQQAYLCPLPSGNKIVLFFYDSGVSHEVAFSGLLNNGEHFASRLIGLFPEQHEENRMAHIATDGETYGHHHKFGNMALAYCLYFINAHKEVDLTVYGEFLEKNPPTHEVEIVDNSSWSCSHGVERWRNDCGCNVGTNSKWNQKWRKSLREGLDWLRDQLAAVFEQEMRKYCDDPWKIRNDYVRVILDRSIDNVEKFFSENFERELTSDNKVAILELLEMQRFAMYMFTSCGWFFDEISGLESSQIIAYAARAIQLAEKIANKKLEPEFLNFLKKAESNKSEFKNGMEIYKKWIKPSIVDLKSVGAHYALSSIFENYPEETKIYCFSVRAQNYHVTEAGNQKLAIGRICIKSQITWEEKTVDFAVLHFGGYQLNGGVCEALSQEKFDAMQHKLNELFSQNNISGTIKAMHEIFGVKNYSIWDLFKNEQGKVLQNIFNETEDSIETHFREIYKQYSPLMQIKSGFNMPLPKALAMTVEYILNRDFIRTLEKKDFEPKKLDKIAKQMKQWNFSRDKAAISYKAGRKIDELMSELAGRPEDNLLLKKIYETMKILTALQLDLDLDKTQNIFFAISRKVYASQKQASDLGDKQAQEWIRYFDFAAKHFKISN